MKLTKLKIAAKFNLLMICVIVFLLITIGIVSKIQIEKAMTNVYTDRVKVVSEFGLKWLNSSYPGEWQINHDQLYKGNVKINDNSAILDDIGEVTGGAVTIFQGDTRIATNVMDEKKVRQTGTKADPKVTEVVLKKGKTYTGEADIVGKKHLTMYQPIKDSSGEVIGMWLVGPPISTVQHTVISLLLTLVATILVTGILAVIITILFTRSIVQPLKTINSQLKEISEGEGDLTKELSVKSRDEIGDLAKSFNRMLGSLREMMNQISSTTSQVAASSEELLASSEESTAATNQVANTITEVASSVEVQGKNTEESAKGMNEITTGISRIANNASTVAEASIETTKQANVGNENLQNVVKQMNIISQASSETNHVIQELEKRSTEIGKIIEVITGIADQTNLLALNAAIESARAGEHGKGFSVVADEVRKLAEQSRQSANQISEIIQFIQTDTNKAAQLMNNGTNEITNGLKLAEETGKVFEVILESIENVNAQTQELSAVSEEMSAGVQQVNASIDEVSELAKTTSANAIEIAAVTEEQLASTEEVSTSATSLAEMAEKLKQLVGRFKI